MVSVKAVVSILLVVGFAVAGGSQLIGPAKAEYERLRDDTRAYIAKKRAERDAKETSDMSESNNGGARNG